MRIFLSLTGLTFLLQGCFTTAQPTLAQLLGPQTTQVTAANTAAERVEPLKAGQLPQCQAAFGSDQRKWTQCSGSASFNGWMYTGPWVGGAPNYQGQFKHSDGTTYVGQSKNGRFDGQGKLTYRDGISYDGSWSAGQKKGQGTWVYAKGYGTYEGQVDFDGKRHGKGTRITPDGTRITGQWDNDKPVGTAKVTFPDGSSWEGSHSSLWSKRTVNGKATKAGEVIQADIQQVGVCPNCIQFEVVYTQPTNCNRFAGAKPSFTSSGLPRQVGPFAMGMNYGHFECVSKTKFKDISAKSGLEQGVNLLFGMPSTFVQQLSGGDLRVATGWLTGAPNEVKNLFKPPRLPTLQAFFWNNRLYMINLDGPSVPLEVLRQKYGSPKASVVEETERCMQPNGSVSSMRLRESRWTWKDSNVLIRYSNSETLDRDYFKGGLPSCAKIITQTNYMVLDLRTEAAVSQASKRSNADRSIKDLKKFDAF